MARNDAKRERFLDYRIRNIMTDKNKKHRFVLLIEPEILEEFKKMAEEQNRTAGNLGTTLIKEYVKNNKKN